MAWGQRRRLTSLVTCAFVIVPVAGCQGDVEVPPSPSSTTTASTAGGTTSPSPTSPTSAEPPAPDRLRVAISFDQPGIGLKDGDSYSGLDADTARYIAQQLGVSQLTFVQAIPDQRETLLSTGQVDMVISGYSMTPERAQQVRFAGPYLTTGQDLLVSRRSKITKPEQLRGFTVCSAEGSASTQRLVDDYPGLHVIQESTVGDCVAKLRDDKVKAVTSDAAILAGYLGRTDGKNGPGELKLAGHTFSTERYGVAVARDNTVLCYQVSKALRSMVSSGDWTRTVKDNLPTRAGLAKKTYERPTIRTCRTPEPATSTTTPGTGTTSATSGTP